MSGLRWSADGQTAWRLRDGHEVKKISLEEAHRLAVEHGLEHPPPPEAAPSRLQRKLEKRRAAREDAGEASLQPIDMAEAEARSQAAAAALPRRRRNEKSLLSFLLSKKKKNKKKKNKGGGNSSANDDDGGGRRRGRRRRAFRSRGGGYAAAIVHEARAGRG